MRLRLKIFSFSKETVSLYFRICIILRHPLDLVSDNAKTKIILHILLTIVFIQDLFLIAISSLTRLLFYIFFSGRTCLKIYCDTASSVKKEIKHTAAIDWKRIN
jgi:hypothetical protein